MNIKKYVAWRLVHMVITLLIVLVLLFVLFRLMPGNAAQAYLVKPGISQIEKDGILIRYGMAKRVPMPGDYFKSSIEATQVGQYTVNVRITDTSGNVVSGATRFDVVVDPASPTSDTIPPVVSTVGAAPVGQPMGTPISAGNAVNLSATVTDDKTIRSVIAYVSTPDNRHTRVVMNAPLASANYSAQILNVTSGIYSCEIVALDTSANNETAVISFAVGAGTPNPTIYNLRASLSAFGLGQSTNISADILNVSGTPTIEVRALNGVSQNYTMANSAGTGYYAVVSPTVSSDYVIIIRSGSSAAQMGIRVNNNAATKPSPSTASGSFTVSDITTEAEIAGAPYPYVLVSEGGRSGAVDVYVNLTASPWEDVANANATIIAPDGNTHAIILIHPTKVVPRAMYEQFVIYMKGMLVFDFGSSFNTNRPVWDEITSKIPATLWLFGNALITATIIGIAIGMFIAWRRGSAIELGTIVATLFFYSMPIFWFGLLAQWIFYVQLGWFPLSGIGGTDINGVPLKGLTYVTDMLHHLLLPLATLTVLHLAGNILLMRTAMLEVLGEDFVVTARAKGLKERTIMYKHAARNAMLPVVTSLAMAVSGVISGGVLTETIFSWPGMGSLLIRATLTQDYPVVQGAFYILAIMTILGNMAADILYAYLDPRVQL